MKFGLKNTVFEKGPPNVLETKSLNCNVILNQKVYRLLTRVKRSPRNTQIFTPNKPKIVFADFEE